MISMVDGSNRKKMTNMHYTQTFKACIEYMHKEIMDEAKYISQGGRQIHYEQVFKILSSAGIRPNDNDALKLREWLEDTTKM